MYAQQYRQPPKDYGGTAIRSQITEPEPVPEPAAPPPPEPKRQGDELLLAVVIMTVLSGGWEKNALVLMALFFILI
jgi:hypothetical protein